MRSLTLTGAAMLAAALMTGCGAGSEPTAENAPGLTADAAAGYHTRVVEPFTESLFDPCNGEEIVFSGQAITTFVNVNGLHFILEGSASATGTGLESGATYKYNLNFHETFQTPSGTSTHFNFFANANARIISSDPALSFTAHFVNHGVVLPSGELKLTRNVDRVECKA